MNSEEKSLLKSIYDNPYAIGAFSGMVFNASLQYPDKSVEELIELALRVRIKIGDMAYGSDS